MKKTKKVKKRALKNKRLLSRFSVFVLLLFVILGFVLIVNASSVNKKQAATLKAKADLVSIPVSDWSFRRFSNTTYKGDMPKATPIPQVYTGYCLRVPVLMYHHIQPESIAKQLGQTSLTVDSITFDQQMAYLAQNGYTTIWASDLINALINHTGLSPKSVVITMDDGYADNYTYALPILQKYNIKANIMLASGLMGSNPDMLTWDQVNGLKSSGLYYFTNHTWSHFAINRGPQNKIETEIDTAQTQIQQHTGQTVNVFTYPYGAVSSNAILTLQKKGYLGAFTEIPGFYQCDSFLMTLHRTRIGNSSLSAYGI